MRSWPVPGPLPFDLSPFPAEPEQWPVASSGRGAHASRAPAACATCCKITSSLRQHKSARKPELWYYFQ